MKPQNTINRAPHTPRYLALYQRLRDEILSGALKRADKLPSKREMTLNEGVSVITVEHAYALLVEEGYVEAREKSGFYVTFDLSGKEGQKKEALPRISGSITEAPDDFPFSVYQGVIRRVLSSYDRRILVKSPNSGLPELREAIAAYLYRSRALNIDPEDIVIGAGAEYLYGLLVELLGRDNTYYVEDPCYEKIRKVYAAQGVRVVPLKIGPDGISGKRLSAIESGVLHVTPYKSYPSGVTASAAKRRAYARLAAAGKCIVIEDDYDSEFASPTRPIETVFGLSDGPVIAVNTFTKTLAPSIRTGYMILPKALRERFREQLGFYSCTVPVLDQLVLAVFLSEGHYERYISRRRRAMKREPSPR